MIEEKFSSETGVPLVKTEHVSEHACRFRVIFASKVNSVDRVCSELGLTVKQDKSISFDAEFFD